MFPNRRIQRQIISKSDETKEEAMKFQKTTIASSLLQFLLATNNLLQIMNKMDNSLARYEHILNNLEQDDDVQQLDKLQNVRRIKFSNTVSPDQNNTKSNQSPFLNFEETKEEASQITPWNQNFYFTRKTWLAKEENSISRQYRSQESKTNFRKTLSKEKKQASIKKLPIGSYICPNLISVSSAPVEKNMKISARDHLKPLQINPMTNLTQISPTQKQRILDRIYSRSCENRCQKQKKQFTPISKSNFRNHGNDQFNAINLKRMGSNKAAQNCLRNYDRLQKKCSFMMKKPKNFSLISPARPILQII